MDIISLYPDSPDSRALQRAANLMQQGQVIIYPTDSNPALAALPTSKRAINELCRLKGIDPAKQTLTLVCASIQQATKVARIDNRAFEILRRNTPGPFTFILPSQLRGRKEIGIRIPANPIALALAEELDSPIVSGSLSNYDPLDLDTQIPLMLADASAEYSAPQPASTALISLLNSSEPEILREGPLPLQ